MNRTTGAWFQSHSEQEPASLRLFCFPYAGGTALVFNRWKRLLPSSVQIMAAELPGRGLRLHEPPFISLPALIDELKNVIRPCLGLPFVFFGHSMGAIIAFELARTLRREYGVEPQALLVAGRRAPQIPKGESVTYNLPRDEFIKELIRLDGTPREIIEHVELMEIIIPLLRADFQLVQTYEYAAEALLQCPIVAYGGEEDREVPRDKILPWSELTTSRFALHMLPGDHFFLRSAQAQLLELIKRELSEVLAHASLNRRSISRSSDA
ncbi:MAG TPA: alpha/beta fold hydrolase [Blastocatellia bacterium]|nr:alpha/beta fold hydrolase [Blastocatellia bacterium]